MSIVTKDGKIWRDDAGFFVYKLMGDRVKMVFGIDEGKSNAVEIGTVGLRCAFVLKEIDVLKGIQYGATEAAKMLYKDVENFVKTRFAKVFACPYYRVMDFGRKYSETSFNFPQFNQAKSLNSMKFNKNIYFDVLDSVKFHNPTPAKKVIEYLTEETSFNVIDDPLFSPNSEQPWAIQ